MQDETFIPKRDQQDEDFEKYVNDLAKEFPEYQKKPASDSYLIAQFKFGSKEISIVDADIPIEMQKLMLKKFNELNGHLNQQ